MSEEPILVEPIGDPPEMDLLEDDEPIIEPLFYVLRVKAETWVRVYVNDLILYKEPPFVGQQGMSDSYALNELLVPGENRISYEVLRAKDRSMITDPGTRWAFRSELYLQTDTWDPTATLEGDMKYKVIHAFEFPTIYEEVKEKRFHRTPFFYEATFQNPWADFPEPVWKRAPEAEFDDQGLMEQRAAIEEIVDAIKSRNADAFLDAIALKMDHESSAFDSKAYKTKQPEAIREFFDMEPTVDDLDWGELHFRPLHGGRVAHLTRLDGGFALDAYCEKEPDRRLRSDFLLTQQSGRWRVFA